MILRIKNDTNDILVNCNINIYIMLANFMRLWSFKLLENTMFKVSCLMNGVQIYDKSFEKLHI